MGIKVTCIDTNPEKIERLQNGKVPIYEPELDTLIQKNMRAGRLSFGTDLGAVVNSVDVVFIAVGTPPDEDRGGGSEPCARRRENVRGERFEVYAAGHQKHGTR